MKRAAKEKVKQQRHVVALLAYECLIDQDRTLRHAAALAQAGYLVTVVRWDRSGTCPPSTEIQGTRVVSIRSRSSYGKGPRQLGAYLWFGAKTLRWLMGERFLAIHCNDLDMLPWGVIAGRLWRKPVVYDAREAYPEIQLGHGRPRWFCRFTAWLQAVLAKRATHIVTVGEHLKEDLFRLTHGQVPVTVIGNWRDPADLYVSPARLAEARMRLGLSASRLVISYFGGLNQLKPVQPLLEAARRVGGIVVLLGGSGPDAPEIQSWAERYAWVRYFGQVPWSDVSLYTGLCDVVYYPIDRSEPVAHVVAPNTLFVAIGAGKPILTTNVGEIGEIVRRTGCGYLMPDLNERECEAGINYLLDPRHREEMQRAAQAACQKYSGAEVFRRWVAVYKSLEGQETCGYSKPIEEQSDKSEATPDAARHYLAGGLR